MDEEVSLQREYYRTTAHNYDNVHVSNADEHMLALSAFSGLIRDLPHSSILDVGAGTGRGVSFLQAVFPSCRIIGVEPVAELRAEGHAKGIDPTILIDGNALRLPFRDNEFDWVVETGALHHIRLFRCAVGEMSRVARIGVMISDANNMGQGSSLARFVKQAIKGVGLWPMVVFMQTGGKLYKYSDGDGIYYSFCAFDCLDIIKRKFPIVHFMNTVDSGPSLYRTAGHVMIVARKEYR